MDHTGFAWIAGSGRGTIHSSEFTVEGEFVMQIGCADQSPGNTETANVNRGGDVHVYPPTNELFVVDGDGNRRVIAFDGETGAFQRTWGAFGAPQTGPVGGEMVDESKPKRFDLVHGVGVSNDGQIYVSDRAGMRLQVFSIEGESIAQHMMGRREPDPASVADCAGEAAHGRPVAELIENVATAHQSVSRTAFSRDSEPRYLVVVERSNPASRGAREGDAPGPHPFRACRGPARGVSILHDMVSDPDGNLYVAELNVAARAQKFTNTGMAPADSM